MDWARAIERNGEALKSILATLFAMLRVEGTAVAARLPRSLHSAILRILHPAESAVRRLIVIAARGLVAKPHASPSLPAGRIVAKGGPSRLSFRLIDPRKRFAPVRHGTGPRLVPRIHFFAADPRVPFFRMPAQPASALAAPADDGVDARRLLRRLEAVKRALDDLPRQARRLARLRARQAQTQQLKVFKPPLRPGKPPGHRGVPVHDVDRVLAECHALARDALEPDS